MNNDQFTSFLAVITKHHEEDQKALLEEIKALRAQNAEGAASQATSSSTFKNLSDSMNEFTYDPEMNLTFDAWYQRYESVFTSEAAELSEPTKVRLLTGKLNNSDFEQFANAILPLKTHELQLDEAIIKLKSIFGHRQSKFSMRKMCFNITKLDSEDFACYAARVNKYCERFDVKNCAVDEFKAQIFVNGLKGSQDSLILEKLLAKLDGESTNFASLKTEQQKKDFIRLQLQDLVNEADRIISLKQDKSSVAETYSKPEVFAIKQSFNKTDSAKPTFPNHGAEQSQPPSPCLHCGGMHWHRDCPFKDKTCFDCHKTGHKAGYCAMTQSNLQFTHQKSNADLNHLVQKISIIDMDDSHRKYVTPNINGSYFKLQLDTGSDITIISRKNWIKLGKPTLNNIVKKADSASGNSIPLLGNFPCEIKVDGKEEFGDCYVSSLELNQFGIDWITLFDLWNVPISTISNKLQASTANNLHRERKTKFNRTFHSSMQFSATCKAVERTSLQKKKPHALILKKLRKNQTNCHFSTHIESASQLPIDPKRLIQNDETVRPPLEQVDTSTLVQNCSFLEEPIIVSHHCQDKNQPEHIDTSQETKSDDDFQSAENRKEPDRETSCSERST